MYFYDVEINDDQDIYFKFLSEGTHQCLSALYETKKDDQNPDFINNFVRGCTIFDEDDAKKLLPFEERCQIIASRISIRNRAIEN